MRTFHPVHERPALAPQTNVEERLPMSQAAAIIVGLSVLSWGAVILLLPSVRAIF